MKKRLISTLLALCIALSLVSGASGASTGIQSGAANAENYVLSAVPSPGFGSIGGEWAMLALVRGGAKLPDGYAQGYYSAVEEYVSSCGGVLSSSKYTEYARLCLAITALGADVQNVGGYNILQPLGETEKVLKQGINGAIWALIALDSGDYDLAEAREAYISEILAREMDGGGWSMTGKGEPDPDVTGMALTALAPYQSRSDVKSAIDRALAVLSGAQNADGGFGSVTNTESTAQVVVALCSLGVSLSDSRFVKGGKSAADALLQLQKADGSFPHTAASRETNQLSTEQGCYALVAALRAEKGETALFDMSDATALISFGLSGKHADVRRSAVTSAGTTFSDISGSSGETAILALASREIINGMGGGIFAPNDTMTRAQFAAIVVRALGLPLSGESAFTDVSENSWYFSFVSTASKYGIITGRGGGIFDPTGTITRQEAAIMVSRAADLCGLEFSSAQDDSSAVLARYSDGGSVSSWAARETAFCCSEGIFPADMVKIEPRRAIKRGEIAQMIYNLLAKSDLL